MTETTTQRKQTDIHDSVVKRMNIILFDCTNAHLQSLCKENSWAIFTAASHEQAIDVIQKNDIALLVFAEQNFLNEQHNNFDFNSTYISKGISIAVLTDGTNAEIKEFDSTG